MWRSYTKKGIQKEKEQIRRKQKKEQEKQLKKKKRISMDNITINFPEIYDKKIQELIQQKIIPSRSEAIRTALREYLYDDLKFFKKLGE